MAIQTKFTIATFIGD
ncbi:host cell division inhibitory peptide Kil, partial [Escherichia coli]